MFKEKFTDYDFPLLGLVRLPEVKITDREKKQYNISIDCSNYEFLRQITFLNFENKKNKLSNLSAYKERAEYELEIFEELGFTDYVLLVWKVINKLRELGGFVDYGRGSCAGSFVFALLGITGILDVIDKGLLFERFVSKVRSKKEIVDGITYLHGSLLCDADLNLGGFRKDITEWLKQEYKGKICKIATLSTLTSKLLIKDVYKTFNEVNEDEAKRIADMVEKHSGIAEDIEKMAEENKEFKKWIKECPKTYEMCLQLRELLRNKSSHASGCFISYCELDGFVPYELNKDKEITLSFEMKDASEVGVKLDLLGLTLCEIMTDFLKMIPEKLEDIDLENNPIIYDNLQNEFLPYGLYQISGDTAYAATLKIKPKNLLELCDVNAIGRPGALDYLEDYVSNNAKSPHKIFDKIVSNTRNLFLYQEQLMQAIVAVGFSLDDAETCRKIVGKKLKKEFPAWEQKIRDKVKENNLPTEVADVVWKVLIDSSGYSFNKSHSLGVSKLGALTVWAKYKYPLQFYTACLNLARKQPNPTDEISAIEKELKHFNIKLLSPDIVKSKEYFDIEGNNIRFSLQSIKGVSSKTLEKIQNFRHEYSSKFDIFLAAKEAKLGIGVLSALIQSGCLSDYCKGVTRSALVLESQLYNVLTPNEQKRIMELGDRFDFNLFKTIKYLSVPQEGSIKPFIKPSRMETLRGKFQPYKDIYNQNSKNEKFACWFYENQLLGYSYSYQLFDILKEEYPDMINLYQLKGEFVDTKVRVGGRIIEVKSGTGRTNRKKYINYIIDDSTNRYKIQLQERLFEKNSQLNNNIILKEGDVIVSDGKLGKEIIWADSVVSQNIKIYTKLSQLKEENK